MFRRAILTLLLFLALFIVTAPVVFADGPPTGARAGSAADRLQRVGNAAGLVSQNKETDLATYIGRVINAAMSLLGVIFVAQMVYAGYLWMTAASEEEKVTKAQHIIRRSIIGLAIVLGAWAITVFVLTRLYAAVG